MNDGWIKIYRQLLSWEWFDNSKMVHIFLYFLLQANTKEKEWRGLTIQRGQFATSVPTISAATGLSEQEIRTCVKRLVNAKQIVYNSTHRATHRCVIVTICNFEKYQVGTEANCDPANEPFNEPATDNQRTSNEPATDNQREHKNNKKERKKEYIITSSDEEVPDSVGTLSASGNPAPDEARERIPFKEIQEAWNTTCKSFPALKVISDSRKNKIRLRVAEMGGVEAAMPLIRQIFEKTEKSSFLRGDSRRGWKASFDWIFQNDKNWDKIYGGQYDDRPAASRPTTTIPYPYGTTPTNQQPADPATERRQRFAQHIANKLATPDAPEPDLSGNY